MKRYTLTSSQMEEVLEKTIRIETGCTFLLDFKADEITGVDYDDLIYDLANLMGQAAMKMKSILIDAGWAEVAGGVFAGATAAKMGVGQMVTALHDRGHAGSATTGEG